MNNHTGRQYATKSMKVNIFVSSVSVLFLNLIYYGAGTDVHLLQFKLSMHLPKKVIAQWIRQHPPFYGPGFESQYLHFSYFIEL